MAKNQPIFIPRPNNPPPEPEKPGVTIDLNRSGSLYHVAVELAKERGEKLKLLKAAILREDTPTVYRIAASLCGLGENYEASDRAS